ncbi:MAG: hypothetical protein JNK27_11100 [Chitinophagaceae bacterium]|nr:hypothetical protein [Chitinophagaceae bacterium]
MKGSGKDVWVLWFSLPLAALVVFVSATGLSTPGFYAAETTNWQAQSAGQDLIDLFIVVPALLISAVFAYHKRKAAILVWGAVIAYLLYTFLIYCFAVHFNQLFIFYCFTLGLSFYSWCWFFFLQLSRPSPAVHFSAVPHRIVGIYFIVIAALFYFLWMVEIIPAVVSGEVPKSVKETGLITNAVHVIDLSVFLPGLFIAGVLLLKRKIAGYMMEPVFLSFFVLMNITIGSLVLIMIKRGIEGNYSVAIIMGMLTIISTGLLVWYIKRIKGNKN